MGTKDTQRVIHQSEIRPVTSGANHRLDLLIGESGPEPHIFVRSSSDAPNLHGSGANAEDIKPVSKLVDLMGSMNSRVTRDWFFPTKS